MNSPYHVFQAYFFLFHFISCATVLEHSGISLIFYWFTLYSFNIIKSQLPNPLKFPISNYPVNIKNDILAVKSALHNICKFLCMICYGMFLFLILTIFVEYVYIHHI